MVFFTVSQVEITGLHLPVNPCLGHFIARDLDSVAAKASRVSNFGRFVPE